MYGRLGLAGAFVVCGGACFGYGLGPSVLTVIERQSCLRFWPEGASVFFRAIVTTDDGAFVVTFPDAPGCVTQVDDADQVLPMATEALAGWMAATREAGDAVPTPSTKRRAPRGGGWSLMVPVVGVSRERVVAGARAGRRGR